MYERMLNKMNIPTMDAIQETIGKAALDKLNQFESFLMELYDLHRELKFPFGNNYGWGYKYSHKNKHLCYLFFEQGGFTIFTQIGDKQVSEMENKLVLLSDKAKSIWSSRYPCGEHGGWINYRVIREEDIMEALEFIKVKVKPIAVTNK
jgi:hypothetical protein